MKSDSAIIAQDVVKVYTGTSKGDVRALDGLTLQVRKGEIFGLLGPNGAGKTTLLKIMTTLLQPTAGSVEIAGWDVVRNPLDVRKSICVVLQQDAVELFLSLEDNLRVFAAFQGIPRREIDTRSRTVMDLFGLEEYRRRKAIDLSGGLKRRLQVAKVFMVDAPVVLLDEATTGMDPINKRVTLEAIRMQASLGRTIFLTTHILGEAEELCDTIAIIDRGKIIACGDLGQIRGLAPDVYDVSITFERLEPGDLQGVAGPDVLSMDLHDRTVDLRIKADAGRVLALVTELTRGRTVLHFEANSATLEDVFMSVFKDRVAP